MEPLTGNDVHVLVVAVAEEMKLDCNERCVDHVGRYST